MRCRTVRSLACFVGMSCRAEPSDREFQTEGALTRKAFADNARSLPTKRATCYMLRCELIFL